MTADDPGREATPLQRQAEAVRAELSRLRQVVDQAGRPLDSAQAARLLEANEQLVSTALRVEADARAAALDTLTELPNRLLLLERFAHAVDVARRHGGKLALLFVDLNNFKHINDTLGHAVGDQVLKRVAQCLGAAVRGVDTVSRHGGDEFLILLAELGDASDAVVVAEKMTAALDAPSRLGEHVLRLKASIGIAVWPDDGEDAGVLIERADAAMYRAKRHGLGSAVFGSPDASERDAGAAVQPLASLRQPLVRHELALAEHERRDARLREENEQLVLAVLSARELQAAAEQAQRRQAETMAMVAHELRNPLAPIRSAAALLGHAAADTAMLPRLQAMIERQVRHMTRLVGDLTDVARAQSGKLRLEFEDVDLGQVIDAAVDACRPAMDTRLQRFEVRMPAGSLALRGDPVRLTQVVSNLLDNASKYTPEGGRVGLSVGVVDGGEAIALSVSDSGIGIAPDGLATVFEPFVQEAHALGVDACGLGIGLTVVRELVKAHGGSVEATSGGRGHGCRFVVTLPVRGPAPAAGSEPAQA